MRNWNILSHGLETKYKKLNLYLWGIETVACGTTPIIGLSLNLYLWGIETENKSWARRTLAALNLYLWGIETQSPRKYWDSTTSWIFTYEELKPQLSNAEQVISLVESLPMRNWNNIPTSAACRKRSVESLPMRNWNLAQGFDFEKTKEVESLPMRNWNSYWVQININLVFCWIFTYEELKLYWCRPWSAGIYGWIFTYEELKLLHKTTGGSHEEGWIFTYEELKPYMPPGSPTTSWPLNLYLWGIETVLGSNDVFVPDKLNLYLWGIETTIRNRQDTLPGRWIFTYEELKQYYRELGKSADIVESLPMRNWNSGPEWKHRPQDQLNLYLWGIETI